MKSVATLTQGAALFAAACLINASPTQAATYGAWTVEVQKDPITDTVKAIASLPGEAGSLIIKCDAPGPGSLYVRFVSNGYLGGYAGGQRFDALTYRVDEDVPVTSEWVYYKSIVTAVHEERRAALIQRLKTAKRFSLRATTFENEVVNASFELSSVAQAISATDEVCKSGA